MRALKRILFLLLSITVIISAAAAELNFPYSRVRLKVPPSEDPFPGLGNYYSTLAKGAKSALWNPASLGKLKLSEASLKTHLFMPTYNYERSFSIEEFSENFEIEEGQGDAGSYGIFFRKPNEIGPGLNTQEVDVFGHVNYATESTGINFTTALKVNEWLSVGFTSNSPFGAEAHLAGDFPVTAKAVTSLYNQQLGDEIAIGSDGKLKYTFDTGSGLTTYESVQGIWEGFLSQEATIPTIALGEFRNDMEFQSPFTSTIASKLGNFYAGLNMIPVYATANIDNDIRTVVSSDTGDIFLYTPNFDPDNETDLVNWINDPDQYGTANGYQRKQIKLPAGETVATTKYRGYFAASTARFDLGAMYDVTDWFTVGLALENITSSSLNFKGTGIASYINYREIDTSEAENITDLLVPGGKTSLDLFSDRWVTTYEVEGTKLFIEPEKTFELPKKIRYGFAFKKPILLAIDFEQNQTPIKIKYVEDDVVKEINISNISFIRIGLETQFFALPWWLRSGLTLMSKPSVSGLEPEAEQNFNDAFQLGFLPIKFDLGSDINAWGTLVGGSFGMNGQTMINTLQLDSTNLDLSKMLYYSVYVGKDAWQVTYLAEIDPLATAAGYGSKTVPAGEEKSFEFSDVKFIQTLGVTYRF